MPDEPSAGRRRRCVATVWKRDTYRYAGGKRRFKMHYRREQCMRPAKEGHKFCSQHQTMQDRGYNLLVTHYREFVEPSP